MKFKFLAAASALALASVSAPVLAQHQHMPGMTMPMPEKPATKKKPAVKKKAAKKPAAKKPAAKKPAAKKPVAKETAPESQAVQPTAEPMDHGTMDHSTMDMPPAEAPPPVDHSQMDHSPMDQGTIAPMDHSAAGHAMAMTGALGPYPLARESSGTAWQPDNSEHAALHATKGHWTLMAHAVLNLVADHQSGLRGDDKIFASGMVMAMARRPIGNGTLQFKAMLSPDPIMGKRGYPLLLASGETADGITHLIDRQHPHDFFMELSASVSQRIGEKGSVFLYGGLPGEPAFGPPAFMHREAILDSPEAPITHHWLDSTHISFGVLTAGVVLDRVKLEVSRFNGREPDQHRWNIETGPLDSTSVRVSWNPTASLSFQGSWGYFKHPEQLEPEVNQKRLSASLLYAREIARGWKLAGTLAWGRKRAEHHSDDAFAAEGSLKHGLWTIFSRAEMIENRELVEDKIAHKVGKVSLGAVRDFPVANHWSLGLGGLVALNFVPESIAPLYGGNHPIGVMSFVRLKLH